MKRLKTLRIWEIVWAANKGQNHFLDFFGGLFFMDTVELSDEDFKALASKERRYILMLLRKRNHSLTELSKGIGLSLTSTKKHLVLLEKTTLICLVDDKRKWTYYGLTKKGKAIFEPHDFRLSLTFVALVSGALAIIIGFFALNYFYPQIIDQVTGPSAVVVQAPSKIDYRLLASDSVVELSWEKAPQDGKIVYSVMRKKEWETQFNVVASDLEENFFIDKNVEKSVYSYVVEAKAIKNGEVIGAAQSTPIEVIVNE